MTQTPRHISAGVITGVLIAAVLILGTLGAHMWEKEYGTPSPIPTGAHATHSDEL